MKFSIDKIDSVRAVPFPVGQLQDGKATPLPGLVLLCWRSDETTRLFQAYVNKKLTAVTAIPQQRMMLVEYDHTHPAAIELAAVDPADKFTDFSSELGGFTSADGTHVKLGWPRRGSLPLDSVAKIYWDAGSGVIDTDNPLDQVLIWSDERDKWGWGLDRFGRGDFGYSGTGAPGWGLGVLGQGEFGFDAEMMAYESDELLGGRYKFALRLFDTRGTPQQDELEIFEVFIDPIPEAPMLIIDSYNPVSDTLVLQVG